MDNHSNLGQKDLGQPFEDCKLLSVNIIKSPTSTLTFKIGSEVKNYTISDQMLLALIKYAGVKSGCLTDTRLSHSA